jgi:hypothetical protein
METEPGLEFTLGDDAFRAHSQCSSISIADVEIYGNEGGSARADGEGYEYADCISKTNAVWLVGLRLG